MDSSDLGSLRARVDALDQELIALLAERFSLTGAIGTAKAAAGEPPIAPARRRQRTALLRDLAIRYAVDEGLVEGIYGLIADTVVEHHKAARAAAGPLRP